MQTMNDYLKHWVPHPEAYYWTAPIGCAENVLVKYNRELKLKYVIFRNLTTRLIYSG